MQLNMFTLFLILRKHSRRLSHLATFAKAGENKISKQPNRCFWHQPPIIRSKRTLAWCLKWYLIIDDFLRNIWPIIKCCYWPKILCAEVTKLSLVASSLCSSSLDLFLKWNFILQKWGRNFRHLTFNLLWN